MSVRNVGRLLGNRGFPSSSTDWPVRNRQLPSSGRVWESRITGGLEEMGPNVKNWIELARNRHHCRTIFNAY